MSDFLAKVGSEVGTSAFTWIWWAEEPNCPESLIR